MAHPVKQKIAMVRIREIALTIIPARLSFMSTRPAAHPAE